MTITNAVKGFLNKMNEAARQAELGTRLQARGIHTVTSAEGTAGTLDIDTGFANGEGFIVQIMRSGAVVTADAAISLADGVLTVADGGATYAVTADDVINYLVY